MEASHFPYAGQPTSSAAAKLQPAAAGLAGNEKQLAACLGHRGSSLEHDPEKACPRLDRGWIPVFGKRSCSTNNVERDDDSKISHPALGKLMADLQHAPAPLLVPAVDIMHAHRATLMPLAATRRFGVGAASATSQ